MAEYLLDKQDQHIVTYHEVNESSDKLVICFSPNGPKMLKSKGFASAFCEKKGWNYIYAGCANQTFFDSLKVDNLCRIAAPFTDGRDVVTYGSNAGGFAALWFGSFLNARILSASPRNFLHELIVPSQSNNPAAPMNVWLTDAPKGKNTPVILYDSTQRIDRIMVHDWALPAYQDATVIEIINGGHHTLERMKNAGVLSKFLTSFINDNHVEIKDTYFPEGSLGWNQDMAALLLRQKKYTEARDLLCQYATKTPEHMNTIFSQLVSATVNEPSSEAVSIIRTALGRLDQKKQKLSGKTVGYLRHLKILTD